MGSVGDAYDNAMAESFFSTLEAELLSRGLRWPGAWVGGSGHSDMSSRGPAPGATSSSGHSPVTHRTCRWLELTFTDREDVRVGGILDIRQFEGQGW
jgi:hypothetical protein